MKATFKKLNYALIFNPNEKSEIKYQFSIFNTQFNECISIPYVTQ